MRTLKIYTALLLILLSLGSGAIAQCTNASITTNPSPVVVCAPAANASFTVVAAGTTLTYQWQMNTGSGYTNVVNGATYSGATTATVTIANPTVSMNGTDFRCLVTAACGPTVSTSAVSLGVLNPPTITSQPTQQTVCPGGNATFTVNTSGSVTSYQWQSNSGSGYTNVTNGGVYAGATTNSLSVTGATAPMNGTDYRCLITGTCGTPFFSSAVSLQVNSAPTVTSSPANATICPNTNTSFSVIATGQGLSYQWQANAAPAFAGFANLSNGPVYSNVIGATLSVIGAPASMDGTIYRCVVSGACTPAATSGTATLSIYPTTVITSNPVNSTICETQNTSFSVAATGPGLSYQWQINAAPAFAGFVTLTNGGVYSGATTSSLNISGATIGLSGNQYRCVVNGTCPSTQISTAGTLTVNIATPVITAQPVTQVICAGQATVGFSITATGTSVAYQWQMNTGSGYVNVVNNPTYSGATTNSLSILNPTTAMNGTDFRCLASATCGTAISSSASLTVIVPPTIVTQPTPKTVCAGGNTTFAVVTTGNGLTYQWQSSTGSGYTNIVNGGVYGGATTATLTVTGVTLGMNATDYRCIVTGTCGTPLTTAVVSLTVPTPVSIVTSPTNVTTCPGTNVSFNVVSGGTGTITYQWQVNAAPAFAGFTDIAPTAAPYSGQQSNTLTIINPVTTMGGSQYRCVVTGLCAPLTAISGSATLNFLAQPAIVTNPANATICENTNTSFSVTASGAGLTYQWQAFTGGAWSNLPIIGSSIYSGVNGPTLTLTNTPASLNLVNYRCVVSGTCTPSVISNSAFLIVNTATVITTQPANAVVCGNSVSTGFVVGATGGSLTYQWQEFVVGGSGWVNLANAGIYSGVTTNNMFITGGTTALNGNQYRCVITGSCGAPATTLAASLTVNMIPVMTQQPGNTGVCAGANTSLTVSGTGTGLTYQWQLYNGSIWTNLTNVAPYSNVTSATMNITAATTGLNGNIYRCVLSGTCPPAVVSNQCTLTVYTLPAINTNPVPSTICSGTSTSFSVSAVAGNIQYQWQVNTGSGFTDLGPVAPYNGTNGSTLTVNNVPFSFNGYQYRCVVTGFCAPPAISTAALLTVNETPNITANPVSSTICAGNNTSFTANGSATGVSYQWQVSSGTGYTNVTNGGFYSGATTTTLSITGATAALNGNNYRLMVSGTCSPAAFSNAAVLNVNTSPVINVQPVNTTICAGQSTIFNVNATGTALTYQWQVNTGAGFANVTNGGVYSGATAATLNITAAPVTMNGYTYQCIISGTCVPAVTSAIRTLTVNSLPAIFSNPASTSVCVNGTTTMTVGATGTALTYQWQVNAAPAFAGFVNATGSIYAGINGATLSITPTTADVALSGSVYRCIVSGTCAPSQTSGIATLFINTLPTITNQPVASTICAGGNTSFSVTATGTGATYQWQVNTGTGFVNLFNTGVYTGVTTPTMNITGATTGMSGYNYRCVVSGICTPSVISSGVSLTVRVPATITSHPSDVTTCFNNNTTFYVGASGNPLTYQWQVNNGTGWVNLTVSGPYSNVTTATLTINATPYTLDGYQYRCVVSTPCAPAVITNAATLTVFAYPIITQQPISDTLCENTGAAFSVTATGYMLTYEWQVNNGTGWATCSGPSYFGVNSANLTTANAPMSMNGYDFRCKITSGCGTVLYTATASMNLRKSPKINFQPIGISTPVNHTPLPVIIKVEASGFGPLTYQWQIDTVIGGVRVWVNLNNGGAIAGVTDDSLRVLTTAAYLHNRSVRCVVSGPCAPSVTSTEAKLWWYFETGVNSLANNASVITVHPNPVSGTELNVTITGTTSREVSVRVVNNIGSTLAQQVITLNSNNTGTINIGDLAAGVYSLQVTDKDNNVKTVRFVKQ